MFCRGGFHIRPDYGNNFVNRADMDRADMESAPTDVQRIYNGSSILMEHRIEKLRKHIDELIQDKQRGSLWFIDRHMLAVSSFAAMLAVKRKLNAELATMIGLLHDIHMLLTDDRQDHAIRGSLKAREILSALNIVSDEELELICTAIQHHSTKNEIHDVYSELIKDADVLSHHFFNTSLPIVEGEEIRLEKLFDEIGLRPQYAS